MVHLVTVDCLHGYTGKVYNTLILNIATDKIAKPRRPYLTCLAIEA